MLGYVVVSNFHVRCNNVSNPTPSRGMTMMAADGGCDMHGVLLFVEGHIESGSGKYD